MKDEVHVKKGILAAIIAGILCPLTASAQTTAPTPGAPDPETVRMRLGPLWIKPTVALVNAGLDTNVFNVDDPQNPQEDFTLTLTPAANFWLQVGPTWLSGKVKEDLIWYKKFSSERAANTSYTAGWTVPLSRMTLALEGTWANATERPGFEIDLRARRFERGFNGGVELRALSKTFLGVRAARRMVDFDDGESFLGRSLHDELNRSETVETLVVRHALTPLTSITVDVSKQQDRFDSSSLRDADSTQATVGLTFAPDALISGVARVGFRNFKPLASDIPEYNGSTAAVNLSYIARGSTRFGFQANRDVEFSFDVNQPYYLLTGFSGSIAQQIFGPVDVEGRILRQRLSYREREGALVEISDRVDQVRNYGFGVGYHVGEDLRVAFNVDQQKRSSDVLGRNYRGLRYGTAITFGF
jgi:hypothetical protein